MQYQTLFFDLDDTLYAPSTGLWEDVRSRMEAYMRHHLGLSQDTAAQLRKEYLETYGTTLRGLQAHFHVDTEEYLAYVHDLPLSEYLAPDPELRSLLNSLPQAIWVFTNADEAYAQRVIEILGFTDCFKGIIDVRAVEFHSKPHPRAFELALKIAGGVNPGACVFFDDTERNLVTAKDLGFLTVRVSPEAPAQGSSADLSISSLHDLPRTLPGLWTPQD